jgi:hypothetical protein
MIAPHQHLMIISLVQWDSCFSPQLFNHQSSGGLWLNEQSYTAGESILTTINFDAFPKFTFLQWSFVLS